MKHTLLVILGITFFSACSSDDGIPTGNNVKLVDWNTVTENSHKENKHIAESESQDFSEKENISNNESEKSEESEEFETEIDPIPNYSSLKNDNDNDEVSEYQDEIISEDEIVKTELPKYPDYSDYEKKLDSQMKTALVNYPRPPSPANLSPYDSRESDTYRKPTTQESSQGSGEFPPMPPSMYLNK
jgi:hypothetical protein